MKADFHDLLQTRKTQVETLMVALLSNASNDISGLEQAMRYGACDGGKRLRAFLVLESANLAGADENNALHVAAALEMVHGYSLIHDDLPAMDNDTLRHGKPCAHLAFDEATAILAGDSLLTFAFDILARSETHQEAEIRIKLVQALSRAAGHYGMAGGQYLDMQLVGKNATQAEIIRLQSLKTGALFTTATQMGAILGNAPQDMLDGLQNYAEKVGLAFQIYDDLLDVMGDAEEMGKQTGKDKGLNKPSFLAVSTVEKAQEKAYALRNEAVAQSIALTGQQNNMLAQLAEFTVNRQQ